MQIRCFCYALQCGTTQGNTNLLPLKERTRVPVQRCDSRWHSYQTRTFSA